MHRGVDRLQSWQVNHQCALKKKRRTRRVERAHYLTCIQWAILRDTEEHLCKWLKHAILLDWFEIDVCINHRGESERRHDPDESSSTLWCCCCCCCCCCPSSYCRTHDEMINQSSSGLHRNIDSWEASASIVPSRDECWWCSWFDTCPIARWCGFPTSWCSKSVNVCSISFILNNRIIIIDHRSSSRSWSTRHINSSEQESGLGLRCHHILSLKRERERERERERG